MTPDKISQLFSIRCLGKGETVSTFDCGDEDLNDFILHEAAGYRQAHLAVTYVIESKDSRRVVGFFSLANDRLLISYFDILSEFKPSRRKPPADEKQLKSYPAVKICRLGIDWTAKGLALETFILDFVKSYFAFDNVTGCRFITVDANPDDISFYRQNGFVPLSSDAVPGHPTPLYFDLAVIDD